MKQSKILAVVFVLFLTIILTRGFGENQVLKQAQLPTFQQKNQIDSVRLEIEKLKREIKGLKSEVIVLKNTLGSYQKIIKINGSIVTILSPGLLQLKGAMVKINKQVPMLLSKGSILYLSMPANLTIGQAGPYPVIASPISIPFTLK